MNRFFSVKLENAAIYGLGVLILYLAGAYLGGVFRTFFFLFLFLPVLSLVQMVFTWTSLKYHQEFSTNHPLKGQEVIYTITLTKESIIPSSHVHIRFKSIQQELKSEFSDIYHCPGRRDSYVSEKIIKCPFRGVYTVGLEALEIEDSLRWIKVSVPVWYRTFYVYPRIIELISLRFGIEGTRTNLSGSAVGNVKDYTLFETLQSYRPGEAIRHIAWKKFAALGEPVLRTYDATAQPGVSIYLDTRRKGPVEYSTLEAEDCSVEIMVALVKFFMEREIPVTAHAAGWERYSFNGYNEALFTRFHHGTVNIQFRSGLSPVELFSGDLSDARMPPQSVLFISHFLDPEILNLVETSAGKDFSVAAIINLSGFPEEDKEKARDLLYTMIEKSGKVFPVDSADSIKDDLER